MKLFQISPVPETGCPMGHTGLTIDHWFCWTNTCLSDWYWNYFMQLFPDCHVWFGFTAADARVAAQIGRGTTADVEVYCWLGSHTWWFFFWLVAAWLNVSIVRAVALQSAASFDIFLRKPVDFTDRSVSISKRIKYFNAVVSSVACFGSGHRAIYNSQLPTLDVQLRKLCRSIVGPPPQVDWNAARFFIYGMKGWKILLQMYTLIHGLTSHAKTTGIWPRMLPLYLHIGGCNACYRGILLALVAWAVHDILRNPNWREVADAVWNSHLPSFVNFCPCK